MNTKKVLSNAFIVALIAITCLSPGRLYAQSPSTPLSAVVTSALGQERHLLSYAYMLGRAGLRPEQLVTVTLQFPTDRAGNAVKVAPLDGGEVSIPNNPTDLLVTSDGTAAFQFRAGSSPGLYRLIVQFGADNYRLEFYVLDLAHPEKYPPRLRIVD